MTNAPETRKTHVIRILGTNRNGDVLSDIWADVERIDIAKSASQDSQGFWQGVQRKLDWQDDPTRDDYNPDGNPARELEIVKVCDPQTTTDVNDPDEWIPVPIVRSMKSRRSDAGTQDRHRNNGPDDGTDTLNAARVVEARRIYHYDTSIDDAASAAFDADPSLKSYVAQGSDYVRDDSSKDDGQYVEHEIITFLKDVGNDELVSRRGQIKLLNQYLIDESDPANLDVTGNGGINPPYRLDPYQNIVNVNFGRSVIVAFVDVDDIGLATTTFKPASDKSKLLLDSYVLPLSSGGSTVFTASFYKISANAGEFMQTIAPDVGSGFDGSIGHRFRVYVFAISGSIDDSLKRAKSGADLSILGEIPGLGGRFDPPGLLWSVRLNHLPAGHSLTWKARYGNHRNDNGPLNRMAQVYPLSAGWVIILPGGASVSYSGYSMLVYRLDKNGTGQTYGIDKPYIGQPSYSIDPKWRQLISSAGLDDNQNLGIPFGDPPPLITADLPYVPGSP